MKNIKILTSSAILTVGLFSLPVLAQSLNNASPTTVVVPLDSSTASESTTAMQNKKVPADPSIANNQNTYVFIQTADTATVEPINPAKSQHRITIKNILPFISYISKKMNGLTGSISMNKLFTQAAESNSFITGSKKVRVSGVDQSSGNRKKVNFMAEFMRPHYDESKKTMTYDLQIDPAQSGIADNALILTDVTLSFDNEVCPSCIGG